MLSDEQSNFPKANGADREVTVFCRFLDHTPGPLPKRTVIQSHPHRRLGVQQNHLSTSHSTSIGEIMSPRISVRPFQIPIGLRFAGLCGVTSATGLPFLVMTRVSPVRS